MKDPNRKPHTRSKQCGFENMTPEQLKAAHEKAHQKKIENGIKRKALKEELEILLSEGDTQQRMSLMLIQKCLNGDKDAIKAYEVIRDTIGEKPVEHIESRLETTTINVSIDDDDKS